MKLQSSHQESVHFCKAKEYFALPNFWAESHSFILEISAGSEGGTAE